MSEKSTESIDVSKLPKLEEFPSLASAMKNPSSAISIAVVTKKTDKEVLDAITETMSSEDYSWKKVGLTPKQIKSVIQKLGGSSKDISISGYQKMGYQEDLIHTRKMSNTFMQNNAKEDKKYIVSSRTHTWAVVDKIIVDPAGSVPHNQSSRRRLTNIIEIA